MWIVAIAWVYVVGLMALTETSIVAGIMTFFGYCVLPLSILFYITGGKRRRARAAVDTNPSETTGENWEVGSGSDSSSGSDSDSSSDSSKD